LSFCSEKHISVNFLGPDNGSAFGEFSNAENLYKNLSNAKNALDRVRSMKMEISGKKEG
jgi:hypothetical protein